MKKLSVFVLSAILLAMLAACAPGATVEVTSPETTIQFTTPGPNPLMGKPVEKGRVADVWQGLWHGFIAPVTLVMSFFNPEVQMYEVHNVGNEYNVGFLVGVALVFLALGFFGRGRR